MFFFGIVNQRSGLDVGARLDETLRKEGKSHKEAWLQCGYPNGAEWSHAIAGVRSLDMHKLACLPRDVLAKWFRLVLADKDEQEFADLRADRLRMAKAHLPAQERQKESA